MSSLQGLFVWKQKVTTDALDTHNAWDGSAFTVPVSGTYAFFVSLASTTDLATVVVCINVDGSLHSYGDAARPMAYYPFGAYQALRLYAGNVVSFSCAPSGFTRPTLAPQNRLTIVRIA